VRRSGGIQRAFDEARFGPARTLNLRDSLPTGAEAVRRADVWLRAKQVERAGEVLIITGRGSGSIGQVPVVREAVRKLLATLKRRNVVAGMSEHTPGSFVVQLASMRALFEAPRRSRSAEPPPANPGTLAGLPEDTRARLRLLATYSLEALGVARSETLIEREMLRHFAFLSASLPSGDPHTTLAGAIERAIREYDDLAR